MDSVFFLVPLSLLLGFLWVCVFLWSLERNQYSDLEGSSQRFLYDDDKPVNTVNDKADLARSSGTGTDEQQR